jgi:predicted Rossmann fold flavoprotein
LETYNLIIIGAGASGLFAAANLSVKTLILEKKNIPGRKLCIAGQGRCNFTHAGPLPDFFSHYGKGGAFIKQVLKSYTNKHLIDFFEDCGLKLTVDKNGKLFPASGKAQDILNILLDKCRKQGHKLLLNQPVIEISMHQDHFRVKTKSGDYLSCKLLIATGGMSYPSTGSSGDGYRFAQFFGHTIINPKPALTPIFIRNFQCNDLAGVSIKNCLIDLYRENKKVADHVGDIVFTHKGLSGPGILDFSRQMIENDWIYLNFCHISQEEFTQKFLNEVQLNGKTTIRLFLGKFNIPQAVLRKILEILNIEPAEKIGNINKMQRSDIRRYFCACPFEIEKLGGFQVAMATCGGISMDEINPKSMESRLHPGLYLAGEVIDIDGDTGGYNLQFAFSSGFLAAKSINALCA